MIDIKDIEEYIKIQEFEPRKFYIIHLKTDSQRELSNASEIIKNALPGITFLVVPMGLVKIYGFEPTEDTKKHQLEDMVDIL